MGRWGGRDCPYKAMDGGPGSGIKGHTTAASSQYGSQLKQHILDNDKFDAIVNRLRLDRSINAEEMRALASNYLGYSISKSASREGALQKIIDQQVMEARYTARAPYQVGGGT